MLLSPGEMLPELPSSPSPDKTVLRLKSAWKGKVTREKGKKGGKEGEEREGRRENKEY